MSLDAVPGRSEHSYPLTDTLGGTEPGFDVIVNREALRPLLRALPERPGSPAPPRFNEQELDQDQHRAHASDPRHDRNWGGSTVV
ncbi:hypothetical protein [Streptomyces halobius]|uniref:hypothetical protein n=1 Tax=Streptomyces halobius TaxID=2879846 RepID=UPI0029E80375|nr:hypothetical protein [Streptomyces halobius]